MSAFTLAEGLVIQGRDIEQWRMLLKLTKAATVKHEEHAPIRLSPGIWEIGRVKEYDPFLEMTRQVID